MLAAQLRAAISLQRPTCARDGFSSDIKAQVVRFARHRREAGATWDDIAESIGLSTRTLRTWCAATPGAAMVRVQVVPDDEQLPKSPPGAAPTTHCLVSPGGYHVSGLTLDQLADLLVRVG